MAKRFSCPKCQRLLEPSGEITVDVYQCDECLALVDIMGKSVEVALTFAVDQHGKAFDPASPDGSLPI